MAIPAFYLVDKVMVFSLKCTFFPAAPAFFLNDCVLLSPMLESSTTVRMIFPLPATAGNIGHHAKIKESLGKNCSAKCV